MKKLIFPLVVSIVMAGCGGGDKKDETQKKDEKTKLEFSHKAGAEYKSSYEFDVNNKSSGDRTKFRIELTHKIVSSDKDKTVMQVKYDKITLDATIKGISVSLTAGSEDTTGSDAGMVAASVFGFLNKEYEITYDGLMNKTGEKLIGDDQSMGESFKEGKVQSFVYFPSAEIKAGDTWEHDIDLKGSNKMTAKTTYNVKAVAEKEISLELNGTISGKGESFGHEFSITGSLSGSLTVDRETGLSLNTEINQNFTLSIMGNEVPMEYTIRQSMQK
ncbi:MAG: DUF6263 family protein [Bacteroidota bacterium]